jgi:hypothetical protein
VKFYKLLPPLFQISLFIVLCAGCSPNNGTSAGKSDAEVYTDSSSTLGSAEESRIASFGSDAVPGMKIPLARGMTLVGLDNENFDLERNEEQVIALKDSQNPDSPIKVQVAAYDGVLESYQMVFESETSAVNPKAFAFTFLDIVGDHNIEIICRGMDAEGRQTLDVFHRTNAPTGFGLYFRSIFSIALNGAIEIKELNREGPYQVGVADGVSFPIITQSPDEESENTMDLVERTYYWLFSENAYVIGNVEKIPGKDIEQKQLKELFWKNAAAFAEFLQGNWYLVDEGSGGDISILNFDERRKTFTFFSGDLQESYKWELTTKLVYNRVVIKGINELVSFISRQFSVQVIDLDTIEIRPTDPAQGTYQRLPAHMAEALSSPSADNREIPQLSGFYFSDVGNELYFEDSYFQLKEGDAIVQGGYAVYFAGSQVLELRVLNNAGLVVESRRYKIDFSQEMQEDKVYRTLYLVPGVVGIYGFEATEDNYIQYEQIEAVNTEE